VHPETGEEIQIKTGFDGCAWYELQVGDEVPWEIYENYPGEGFFLDGVYGGIHRGDPRDVWVIVKDHTLIDIIEEHAPWEAWMKFYRIPAEPPREWWGEEAWQALEDRRVRAKEEWEERSASFNGNFLASLMDMKLRELSFMEQMLPAEPVPGQSTLDKIKEDAMKDMPIPMRGADDPWRITDTNNAGPEE